MRPPPFALHLIDLLLPLGPVLYRRMFGGAGLFVDGRMFAILDGETLYLKADDTTRAAFEAAGFAPFVYSAKTRTITLPYHRMPDEILDDPDDLLGWARKAVAAAMRAPPPRGKTKVKAKAKPRARPVRHQAGPSR